MPEVALIPVRWSSKADFARDVIPEMMRQGLSCNAAHVLAAHSCVSCGCGLKQGANNYRLFGIKATESQPYNELTTQECNPRGSTNCRDVLQKFRSFSSLAEGVAAAIKLVSSSRYAAARAAMERGDPHSYAMALFNCSTPPDCWFTAAPTKVAAEAVANFNYFKTLKVCELTGGGIVSLALVGGAAYLGWKLVKMWRR